VKDQASHNSLLILTQATKMLAEADTIQKAKDLKDLAVTAAEWAKRKGLGEEAIQYARSIALDAERKMGGMLKETERNTGGRPSKTRTQGEQVLPPTTDDLGLTRKESSRAQMLHDLPDETYQEVKSGKKGMAEVRREVRREKVLSEAPALPADKFRVIYADPPWQYNNAGVINEDNYGRAERHYPTMSISELCALPIRDLAEDNAVLFLWVTSPLLAECFEVIRAWGFQYKTSFVWDKIKHNFGHYNSVRHEFLLICTRGSCTPDDNKLFDSVQSIERSSKHSEKPEEFRDIIETLYTRGRKIELFARSVNEGWEAWGNESTIAGNGKK
jgi:N6-adenosine-specific RNA methylase IME4